MNDMEYEDRGSRFRDEMDEEEAKNEDFKLVAKETRTVVVWRFIFALVLLGTALGISVTVFLYSRDNEHETFEREFSDNGQKLVDQ